MQSELSQRNPELSGSEHWIGACIAYQLDRIVDENDTSPAAPVREPGVLRVESPQLILIDNQNQGPQNWVMETQVLRCEFGAQRRF
jgi:hypothetical protein